MERTRKIEVMGIVNITDDSYFAESRCLDGQSVDKAVERTGRLLEEGADIIDIGACSTRPGALQIGPDEEWRRLEPVLRALSGEFPSARISIDTYWSSVVERAYGLIGSFTVNDISAGEDDPKMLPLVGKLGLPYIAMHKKGTPGTMQSLCSYPPSHREGLSDVSCAVSDYFDAFALRAKEYGITDWVMDPGFGFAKDVEQNWTLMREMDKILKPGHKTLVGVSRKSMIYRMFGITPEESLPATQALHMAALDKGADILRVHDVAEAVRTVRIWSKL
ncbi:MAG: dihydropteroate synthase [Bacteroidales bacterium]|nr:dihydropteroate synthase [Bacteroidales bacterium]